MTTPFQPLPCGTEGEAPCCSPATATTGLCLSDGTPIAVVTTTPCGECGEAGAPPATAGWINLLTGAYTAGNPPAGAEPCLNQPQQFEVGQWCDLDGELGDVIAPVLVEYEYDDTGALIGVRTLTPGGDPYAVAGTLGLCPGATGDVEYERLCDVAGGVSTPFLRGYTPNGDDTATPHDITLDGAPYVPAGVVSPCCSTVVDSRCVRFVTENQVVSTNLPDWFVYTDPETPTATPASAADGGIAAVAPGADVIGAEHYIGFLLDPGNVGSATAYVNITFLAAAGAEILGVYLAGEYISRATGWYRLPYSGQQHIVIHYRTLQNSAVPAAPSLAMQLLLADTLNNGSGQDTELTKIIYCDGRTEYRDAAGRVTTPPAAGDEVRCFSEYQPVGDAVTGAICRDSATVLVCDAPADSTITVTPAIADATSADIGQPQFQNLAPPYTALWTGGTLNYPAEAGPAQRHRIATGRITAAPAGCADAAGTLTVSVRVTQLGPGTGQLWDGALRLFRGSTLLAFDDVGFYAPPGHVETLTASAPVTAADLASGDLYVGLVLETFHGTAKGWNADQFSASVELAGCDASASTQFLRTITTDCETGEIVATVDTTLDGDPYTVTGEVGACQPASAACCPDHSVDVMRLCDVVADGTSTPFLRALIYPAGEVEPSVVDTELDGTTLYVVQGTVEACAQPTNPQIDSTLHYADGVGASAIVVPTGARSVTVTVLDGAADVTVSGNPLASLPPGSWTWAVDRGGPDGERLADTFSVSGGVGDVFTVHTTREI